MPCNPADGTNCFQVSSTVVTSFDAKRNVDSIRPVSFAGLHPTIGG